MIQPDGYMANIDYHKVIEQYNMLCKQVPQDKAAISAILRQHGGLMMLSYKLAYQRQNYNIQFQKVGIYGN